MLTLPISGPLAPTKTYAARSWAFLPSADPSAHLGTLTIAQGRRDLDSYSLDVCDLGRGCCEVLFAKRDASAALYAVTCNRAGSPVACSCPGYSFGRKRGIVCKHMHAVKELVSDGLLTLAVPAAVA